MADNSQVFGAPVKIEVDGVDAELHPITFVEFGILGEQIIAKRRASIPSPTDMISALESIVFRDGFDMAKSKEILRVTVAEILVQLCDMTNIATDVSFDEILKYVNSAQGLYEAMNLCMKTSAGSKVPKDVVSALTFKVSRLGFDNPKINIKRWFEISGLSEPENPTSSETES